MSLYYAVHVIRMIGVVLIFFFQAEDGIRDLVRSRGLGDVYKRQGAPGGARPTGVHVEPVLPGTDPREPAVSVHVREGCLLYTSDAADERSSVDLGGRRIIKKKTLKHNYDRACAGRSSSLTNDQVPSVHPR